MTYEFQDTSKFDKTYVRKKRIALFKMNFIIHLGSINLPFQFISMGKFELQAPSWIVLLVNQGKYCINKYVVSKRFLPFHRKCLPG